MQHGDTSLGMKEEMHPPQVNIPEPLTLLWFGAWRDNATVVQCFNGTKAGMGARDEILTEKHHIHSQQSSKVPHELRCKNGPERLWS